METKLCLKCNIVKTVDNFLKCSKCKNGLRPECKACQKAYRSTPIISDRIKKYRQDNKDALQNYQKVYREEHKKTIQQYQTDRAKSDVGREYIKKYTKNYRQTEKYQEYQKSWRQREYVKIKRKEKDRLRRQNPEYRLSKDFSRYILRSLSKCGGKQNKKWQILVGYSINELKNHLEQQFTDEMNWDNKGVYWHIDHIRPVCSFNIQSYDCEDFKNCWSLCNLRPLKVIDNLRKGAKIECI